MEPREVTVRPRDFKSVAEAPPAPTTLGTFRLLETLKEPNLNCEQTLSWNKFSPIQPPSSFHKRKNRNLSLAVRAKNGAYIRVGSFRPAVAAVASARAGHEIKDAEAQVRLP